MASTWLEWSDLKGYDKSWTFSSAQLFVPHHQWTFKIERNGRGEISLQIFDYQEPLYGRPVEYQSVAAAKEAAENFVKQRRARAVAAGYAWSFKDFPEYRGGKRRHATPSLAAEEKALRKAMMR